VRRRLPRGATLADQILHTKQNRLQRRIARKQTTRGKRKGNNNQIGIPDDDGLKRILIEGTVDVVIFYSVGGSCGKSKVGSSRGFRSGVKKFGNRGRSEWNTNFIFISVTQLQSHRPCHVQVPDSPLKCERQDEDLP
jgi:hypothetical protein